MKTMLTLTLLAVAATVLVPSVAADRFIVSVSAGGENVTVDESVPVDACPRYQYFTQGLPFESHGGGNGSTCSSYTTV